MLTHAKSVDFRNYVLDVANDIREMFNEANIGHISIAIEIDGRTTDNLKLGFNVASEQYGDRVRGGDLLACVEECLRRKGWSRKNAPLELTYTGDIKETEAET